MKERATDPRCSNRPARRAAIVALLVAAIPAGCGREFFREWANQDVTEVVFEKSRDPRWRIDAFSVDPPWMARFADPYDQDFPPAPPDDYAAQSLSPVPQWSYNRLIVPVEGTGYLAMLDKFQEEHASVPAAPPGAVRPRIMPEFAPRLGEPGYGGPGAGADSGTPPPPATSSPFGPPPALPGGDPLGTPSVPGDPRPQQLQDLNSAPTGPMPRPATMPGAAPPPPSPSPVPSPNSGTTTTRLTPSSNAPRPTTAPSSALRAPGGPAEAGTQARSKPMPPRDNGVRLAAMQAPAPPPGQAQPQPRPLSPPGVGPADQPAPPTEPPASEDPQTDPLQTPRIPGDRGPREIQDLSAPVLPRPDLGPQGNLDAEEKGSEVAGLLGTGQIDLVEAEVMGLPSDAKPYRVNMAQALTLALVTSRVYQYQLEQLYLQALPVTLQRFSFSPQFILGMSPVTPTTGPSSSATAVGSGLAPAINPSNAFSYRTRATGLQQSLLNMGTVAAIGKSFDNGAKVLAGFASQVVFNFTGVNPRQPGVQSYLPLQAFVPLLRGGGRAVTLEGLTQAERSLLYQIRFFAQFRQQFVVTNLAGGSFPTFGTSAQIQGYSIPGNVDPTVGFLNVVEDIQLVENQLRNVATFEQLGRVYQDLIKGEASGLTQLQVDQLDSSLQNARSSLISSRNQFRNDLDAFKMQLGLPPDTPLIVDRRLTRPFSQVFSEVERWARRPSRQLPELDRIAAGLPQLEDVIIDGRSCISTFRSGSDDNLEDLLLAAERVSLENRLDLMNYRAQLYDAWRQLRVTANALKGVLNVTVTNQYLTPPNTQNPLAFLDQAKQFSLVLNAELPLVRINERNQFRSALISYQRARRQLQYQEDYQKLQLRGDVRSLQVAYLNYEIYKRNFVLFARQKDQAFENIVAPPQGGGGGGAGGAGGGAGNAGTNASAAVQTQNLTQAQNQLITVENSLVSGWYGYQGARMTLYRDLGTLPYDEWEAFYELFPSEYRGLGAGGRGYASPVDAPTPSDIPGVDRSSLYGGNAAPAPLRP